MEYVAPTFGRSFKLDLRKYFGPDDGPRIVDEILRRVGEEPVVVLGYGAMGVAYGLPSGRVLKVTSDEGELRALNRLRGLDKRNLIRVFDAFQVSSKMGPMGVIVREDAGEIIDEAARYSRLASHLREIQQATATVYRDHEGKMPDAEAHWLAMLYASEALTEGAYATLWPDEQALIPEIQKALQALLEEHIFATDVSPRNIGLHDGEAIIFDPSFATVEGLSRPVDLAGQRR